MLARMHSVGKIEWLTATVKIAWMIKWAIFHSSPKSWKRKRFKSSNHQRQPLRQMSLKKKGWGCKSGQESRQPKKGKDKNNYEYKKKWRYKGRKKTRRSSLLSIRINSRMTLFAVRSIRLNSLLMTLNTQLRTLKERWQEWMRKPLVRRNMSKNSKKKMLKRSNVKGRYFIN